MNKTRDMNTLARALGDRGRKMIRAWLCCEERSRRMESDGNSRYSHVLELGKLSAYETALSIYTGLPVQLDREFATGALEASETIAEAAGAAEVFHSINCECVVCFRQYGFRA